MFYHGSSSTVLPEGSYKLLPPFETGVLSEESRKKNLDKIFFTEDIGSARIYAGRACQRFGGKPVVFRVIPMDEVVALNQSVGTTVFLTVWAFIESI